MNETFSRDAVRRKFIRVFGSDEQVVRSLDTTEVSRSRDTWVGSVRRGQDRRPDHLIGRQ